MMLNYQKIITLFKRKSMNQKSTGIDQETKRKIIGVAQAVFPEAKIILYGSRARGDYKSNSDIDIAIDCGKKLERVDVGEVGEMLNASYIPYRFDVVDLHGISEEMRKNILREGMIWNN